MKASGYVINPLLDIMGISKLTHSQHGALGHPSNCTNKAISEYFSEGKLPKVGTVCKPNKSSFEHAADLEAKAKKASEDKD